MEFRLTMKMRAIWNHSARRISQAPLGIRHLILPASRFDSILLGSTEGPATTAAAFQDAPLSMLSPCVRGKVLQDLARAVDGEINATSSFDRALPGQCANGSRRGCHREAYDWSRDGLRIECKSAMMCWQASTRQWTFHFGNIKFAHGDVRKEAAFDELILVLYTPREIYFYRHGGKFCVGKTGQRTGPDGYQLRLHCGRGSTAWPLALNNILGKLDGNTNSCSRLSAMPLTDPRVQSMLDRRSGDAPHIFGGTPLAHISPAARGKRLESLVRRVDEIVNPHAVFKLPDAGHCADGIRRRGICHAMFDWRRDDIRVECKSSQLRWDKYWRHWMFSFVDVKVANPACFDDLLLALYTPRGVYIYRHDKMLGLSARGVATNVRGHTVNVYGPNNETDWVVALDVILRKLDTSECYRVAFVQW